MSLTLSQLILEQAQKLNNESEVLIDTGNLLEAENKVADAWHLLAMAEDTYADDAEKIIREARQPDSIFAKIVDIQWKRFVTQEVKDQNFIKVGQRHQRNYLNFIKIDGENRLPDTTQIEASYKESVLFHGLPVLIAIDSIYSHPITHKSATCCNIIYFREVSMGWVQQELGALSCAMSVGKSV